MKYIIIGNLIYLFAAVFTIASSLSSGRRRIYGFQTFQCLTMALASVFFGSASGVVTFLLNALRNELTARDLFRKKIFIGFMMSLVILGVWSNNRGVIGLLPVGTTMLYTTGCYYLKDDLSIKLNIAIDLSLWCIYEVFIYDFVSLAVDGVTVAVTLYAIHREIRKREKLSDKKINGKKVV